MAKELTLFKYTFATPKRRESSNEQQNRSNRQEDAGTNSTETGCAAQQIQYELAQQVTRQESQDTEDSNQSNAICQEHILISLIQCPVPAKQAQISK